MERKVTMKNLLVGLATLMATFATTVAPAAAEVKEVRLAKQYGLGYLPLIVMEEQRLIEKHAKAAGLGDIKVTWATLGGGGAVNDALLSGSVDYISSGVAPLVVLWGKSNGAVKGVSALISTPNLLNTNNPAVKSIRDFTDRDRIALPTAKVSIQAIILQMAAAKEFGQGNYAKLDKLTVTMKHPDGMAALLSGKSEITGHLTSPPFMFQELDNKRVRTVLNSYDVLGGPHTFNVITTTKRFHDNNPKTYAAVFAALEEAIAYINKNKRAAAELYKKASKSKESLDDLIREINQPTVAYTTTPSNVGKFADFMYRTGTIKVKAKSWKDLFFSNVHGTKGS
ncbi:ABC transporter substrate-binding protein [Geotalea sp. SG265]|uniref:ABC transporter substrate-binding protein n=1 Tax=Geotalea sp. SG265 TaxID=2922867 RepID=UPI001FAEC24A|nr:ABC transporter substrate-binding protein [Geotalea sp. SG265]